MERIMSKQWREFLDSREPFLSYIPTESDWTEACDYFESLDRANAELEMAAMMIPVPAGV